MSILSKLKNTLSITGTGDNHTTANFGCTLGVVVDIDDPLQMGRLRVYCPDLNDDPKKPQHLPWASYVSPFGGSVKNSGFTRGHLKDNATTEGVVPYGFWGIPELGANVLVTCINGDPHKRVWMGCLFEQLETGGILTGTYQWPDGPLSSPSPTGGGKTPIQPIYSNQTEAFEGDRESSEWKTRGAEYSGVQNIEVETDGIHSELADAEEDEWVKSKLGAMGYDWTGFKTVGAFLASRIIGFISPGLHSIKFDDRPFNSRIKLQTTAGHQIILDDTNERIYISTYKGKSWVELDVNGNVDVYSDRRISMTAKKDINFSTEESFRVKAKQGIFLYAGDTEGQTPLESIPADGQIRLQSANDTHFLTEGNFYQTINGERDLIINGGSETYVGGQISIESGTDEINIFTPSDIISMEGGVQISSPTIRLEADSTLQLGGGGSNVEIAPGITTIDSPTVAFNDYGTTVSVMMGGINAALACCPAPPLPPVPQIVIPDTMREPEFEADEAELTPWTNRVPQHEPWPRVLKQDSDDEVNTENDGYKNNVDWIDQYDNEGREGREPIGVVEGDDTNERGDFWRR